MSSASLIALQMMDMGRKNQQLSNPATYKRKFTGKHKDTLQYVFDAKDWLRTNNFTDKGVAFTKIFNSLDEEYRSAFMLEFGADSDWEEMNDAYQDALRANIEAQANAVLPPKPAETKETVKNLFKWMIERYPPPATKHEFVQALKNDSQKLNEAPWVVYGRFEQRLKRITRALKYINQTKSATQKIPKVSDEQQLDCLRSIFIRKNNEAKWGNEGLINRRTIQFIDKHQPVTLMDWKTVMDRAKTELLSDLLQQKAKWQPVEYPITPDDLTIYPKRGKGANSKKRTFKDANDELDGEERKMSAREKKLNDELQRYKARHERFKPWQKEQRERQQQNKQLQRQNRCFSCGKMGHWESDCRSKGRGNPRFTPKNPRNWKTRRAGARGGDQRKCFECGKLGHIAKNCSQQGDPPQTNDDGGGNGQECSRCGRYGHKRAACFANRHFNGQQLTGKAPAQPPKSWSQPRGGQRRGAEINVLKGSQRQSLDNLARALEANNHLDDEDMNLYKQYIEDVRGDDGQPVQRS